MKKINNKFLFFILAIFFILALFFNANNFLGFFSNALGNYNFNNGNFTGALNYHKKVENYIKNNTIYYNLGGDYYKLGDYTKSKEYYDKIKTGTGEKEDLDMDYNLGNVFYKLGEKEQNIENKVNLWKESLGNYKKILDKKTDKKAKENYDFVEKKLKSLEEKQDKNKSTEEQQKDQKSGDSKDSKENQDPKGQEGKNEQTNDKKESDKKESDKKEGEKKQDEKAKNENKSGQGKVGDTKAVSKTKELSEDEKRQLEQYNEQLKQDQKDNGKLFGKKSQGNNSQDIFDIFNQDPFFGNSENFDNSILNGNEKDW